MRERERCLEGVGAQCELDGCGSLHAMAQLTAVQQQQL